MKEIWTNQSISYLKKTNLKHSSLKFFFDLDYSSIKYLTWSGALQYQIFNLIWSTPVSNI